MSTMTRSYGKHTPRPWVRPLGKINRYVTLMGLGGQQTVQSSTQSAATAIINRAIDNGVNYIDTSPGYGSGLSETNIGVVMATRRDEVFLATKCRIGQYAPSTPDAYVQLLGTHPIGQEYTPAQMGGSLGRLQTDHVDLLQIHNTQDYVTSPYLTLYDQMVELREAGWTRHLGITGHHNPAMLLDWITTRRFDAILMSLNAADTHYLPMQEELLAEAVSQEMAIIVMKLFGGDYGSLLSGGTLSVEQLIKYPLSFAVHTAIMGCDNTTQADADWAVCRAYTHEAAYGTAERSAIEALTAPAGAIPVDNGELAWEGNWMKEGLREY